MIEKEGHRKWGEILEALKQSEEGTDYSAAEAGAMNLLGVLVRGRIRQGSTGFLEMVKRSWLS